MAILKDVHYVNHIAALTGCMGLEDNAAKLVNCQVEMRLKMVIMVGSRMM